MGEAACRLLVKIPANNIPFELSHTFMTNVGNESTLVSGQLANNLDHSEKTILSRGDESTCSIILIFCSCHCSGTFTDNVMGQSNQNNAATLCRDTMELVFRNALAQEAASPEALIRIFVSQRR